MDPEKDQPSIDKVGVIRWATGDPPPTESPSQIASSTTVSSTTIQQTPTTSHQRLRNKVTYYEKVWSSGQKPSAEGGADETDRGAFAIDVNAFEKRLQEERERKSHEHSPRIDVKLRSTPQPSPRPTDLPLSSNIHVNIRHHIETDESSPTGDAHHQEQHEQQEQHTPGSQHHSRVVTYEKIVSTKSVREVNISSTSSVTSPIVRTVEYSQLYGKSPSSERIAGSGGADDSAYHSHHSRHVSASTPTTTVTSPSSSNTSLHGNFPSEENVFVRHSVHQATPTRERIFVRAGSEPPHSWSSSGTTTSSGSGVAKIATATTAGASPVSSVAAGNSEFVRRHLHSRERHDSGGGDSDGVASPDWYNEYRTHTFHTTTPPRMDFKRSNSQYDNHIRQIRGIFLTIFYFLQKKPKFFSFFFRSQKIQFFF